MEQITFRDFLVKHTFLNQLFISDFGAIFDEEYINNYDKFVINSELLMKWLEVRKREQFNVNIMHKFQEGIDYEIRFEQNKKGGGAKKYVMLTPRCAKKIAQSTNSAIGEKVRDYFIEVEFTLYRYKDHINQILTDEIRRMKENQKQPADDNKAIIYVFRALNTSQNLYKIGRTKKKKNRFLSHNSSSANNIKPLFQFETTNVIQLEKCVKTFATNFQYRNHKEVYEIELDNIKKIIQMCDSNITVINKSKGTRPLKGLVHLEIIKSSNKK
jgi:phage anti-repressor protein